MTIWNKISRYPQWMLKHGGVASSKFWRRMTLYQDFSTQPNCQSGQIFCSLLETPYWPEEFWAPNSKPLMSLPPSHPTSALPIPFLPTRRLQADFRFARDHSSPDFRCPRSLLPGFFTLAGGWRKKFKGYFSTGVCGFLHSKHAHQNTQMHTYMHIHTYTHAFTHTDAHPHLHTYTYKHSHTVFSHSYTVTFTRTLAHIHIYTHSHTLTPICSHSHIHTHTLSYTLTHSLFHTLMPRPPWASRPWPEGTFQSLSHIWGGRPQLTA